MTNNTILLTRLSSREVVDRIEEYDLGEQLRQCSILLSQKWMEKELDFESDFPPIRFFGNRELLQHLWINLIGNAVKYTPRGGEVFVKVREIQENGTPLSLNLQGSLGKQSLSAKQNKPGRWSWDFGKSKESRSDDHRYRYRHVRGNTRAYL